MKVFVGKNVGSRLEQIERLADTKTELLYALVYRLMHLQRTHPTPIRIVTADP